MEQIVELERTQLYALVLSKADAPRVFVTIVNMKDEPFLSSDLVHIRDAFSQNQLK